MLTEDEKKNLFSSSIKAFRDLEEGLIALIAARLATDDDMLAGGVFVSIEAAKLIERHRAKIYQAVSDDFSRAFKRNAETDIRDSFKARPESKAEKKAALDWSKTEAGKIAATAKIDARQGVEKLLQSIRQEARQGYYEAAQAAKRYSNHVGYENALKTAVRALAENGITAYTYTRKDGVVVRVPVDVGIRRELTRAGMDRFDQQQTDIAKRTGARYVDVSFCADARQSHAAWQGQRYNLEGTGPYQNFYTACLVGDMVEGYGGYNCHHTRSLVYSTDEKFRFKDELEGTGYTNEQVRELTTKQRNLENEIRKAKRIKAAYQEIGADTREINAKITTCQREIRQLVSANQAVMKRAPWREQI